MGCTTSRVPVGASNTVNDKSKIKPTPQTDEVDKQQKFPAVNTKFAGVFVGCLLIRFATYSCHIFLLTFEISLWTKLGWYLTLPLNLFTIKAEISLHQNTAASKSSNGEHLR
jgi:hypothetical protein